LPASALISSINSRALFESPPGAGAFMVTAMAFSPANPANFLDVNYGGPTRFYPALPVSAGV
jgi:hypothetical protein